MSTFPQDPEALIFRHEAMATWFEIHIPVALEASLAKSAAGEAFLLLDRLENLLSRYREDSEISMISRLQPGESFRAEEDVFQCLALALSFSNTTGGAFDPAMGREMDVKRGLLAGGEGKSRGRLLLDPCGYFISCEEAAVPLDLGAIGKGYALDRMAELLLEWGVCHALLAGGGSSVKTLTHPTHTEALCWSVGMGTRQRLWLKSGAIGCSGIAVQGAHIIDPHTREPAVGPYRIWVHAPGAAEADAMSTAFMILSTEEILEVVENHGTLAVARQEKRGSPVEWLVQPREEQGAWVEEISA